MALGDTLNNREDFQTWLKALIVLVHNPKNEADKSGVYYANQAWLNQLKVDFPFGNDPETATKITVLENLDEALKYDFDEADRKYLPNDRLPNSIPTADLDEALSALLIEVEGYKRLSNRFFSDLRQLSETEDSLKKAARNARSHLFNKVDEIHRALQQQTSPVGIKPPEFDLCTEKFLTRLQDLNLPPEVKAKVISQTEVLFRNRRLGLEETDLKRLINSWGDVISGFIEDTQDTDDEDFSPDKDEYEFGDINTISDFLCMHDRLDTLYSRLSTNVSRNN